MADAPLRNRIVAEWENESAAHPKVRQQANQTGSAVLEILVAKDRKRFDSAFDPCSSEFCLIFADCRIIVRA